MNQELVGIQIQIAGKAYPLKVAIDETEMVKDVAEDINDKINTLQRTYPRQDKNDYISMAFLSYAIEAQKSLAGIPIAAPIPPQAVTPVAVNEPIISTELREKMINIDAFLDKILAD